MRYLFLVTELHSANGICTKLVMDTLAQEHEVYCITNREYGQKDHFQIGEVSYQTVRPRLVYRMESYMTNGAPSLAVRKKVAVAHKFINKGKLLMTVYSWPLISKSFANRLYLVAEKLCREKQIDCVIPVYTQIDTLIAANRLKKQYGHIRYVPYFLDALSGGYGPRYFSQDWIRNRGLQWERKLLVRADHIIMMESSREHHACYSVAEPYYGKMHFLDLPLLQDVPAPCGQKPLLDEHRINLVYVGTLPGGIRSPEFLLQVFRHLEGEEWAFTFVGSTDCLPLNEAARSDVRIRVVGRCDHDTALQYLAQADVLINIGNTNPNMTPSKIFEYMSFGKPIVSTQAVEQEPSRRYLERYPKALILDESMSAEEAAMKIREFVRSCQGQTIDVEQVRQMFYANTPDAMVAFLKGIG